MTAWVLSEDVKRRQRIPHLHLQAKGFVLFIVASIRFVSAGTCGRIVLVTWRYNGIWSGRHMTPFSSSYDAFFVVI